MGDAGRRGAPAPAGGSSRPTDKLRACRAETDRRLAELTRAVERLVEAQRRRYEEFAAFRMEIERRFAELREELAALRVETAWRSATLAEV
ncbi:MAG: hypothetical protein ACK4OK_10530 [Thermoflexus sp.]